MIKTSATDYESFMKDNRQMVNRYLNTVLWFCVLTGPAIAAGIRFGVFDAVSYRTCILISVVMTLVSAIHFVVIRKFPYSRYVGILALIAMEILLLCMEYGHIHINISWFFVPLLSILFCEKKFFSLQFSQISLQ